jgi:hypothetical protein
VRCSRPRPLDTATQFVAELQEASRDWRGVTVVGGRNRRLYGAGNGIFVYDVSGTLKLLGERLWTGVVNRLDLDDRESVLAAAFGSDALIVQIRPDGSLHECERYRVPPWVTSVAMYDRDTLFVGTVGALKVVRRAKGLRCP